MDKICIEDLEVFCNHGVYKEEKVLGQKFLVSAKLSLDLKAAAKIDSLELSVNYGSLCHEIQSVMKSEHFDLIETVAEKISDHILLTYDSVQAVEITIKKPWAPIMMPLRYVAVEIERRWHRVFIGIGSNMGNKLENLNKAIEAITCNQYCVISNVSSFIETEPVGYLEQENFINAAIEIKTMFTPTELMKFLLEIENRLKRKRIMKWGPRTIDLDILLYDDLISDDENHIIPHPRMTERNFVLEPLSEIAPNVVHPILKKTITQLINELGKTT